jgi:hypothetical protein
MNGRQARVGTVAAGGRRLLLRRLVVLAVVATGVLGLYAPGASAGALHFPEPRVAASGLHTSGRLGAHDQVLPRRYYDRSQSFGAHYSPDYDGRIPNPVPTAGGFRRAGPAIPAMASTSRRHVYDLSINAADSREFLPSSASNLSTTSGLVALPSIAPEQRSFAFILAAEGGTASLADLRTELELPDGQGTLARLDVDGESFYGINAHGQPIDLTVNPISATHGEADVCQQASNAGVEGGEGTL